MGQRKTVRMSRGLVLQGGGTGASLVLKCSNLGPLVICEIHRDLELNIDQVPY